MHFKILPHLSFCHNLTSDKDAAQPLNKLFLNNEVLDEEKNQILTTIAVFFNKI